MLCTLLNSHPGVVCHHELFNPRGIFVALDYRSGRLDLGTVVERDRSPLRFLDRVWGGALGASHIGFKLTRGQADSVMRQVLRDSSVSKIILRRSNRLKTFVSELIAEQTDRWEAYDNGPEMPASPVVKVEIEALEAYSRRNDEFYEGLRQELSGGEQPYIDLLYEDLHCRREHARALSFLGLTPPHPPLSAASVKQSGRDLHAVIANFADLDVALRGTGYHEELHDTRN